MSTFVLKPYRYPVSHNRSNPASILGLDFGPGIYCAFMYLHTKGNEGRTPLSWAVINGREGIVEPLLEQKSVTPEIMDNEGRTLLT
ncbi:hypothetical protein B9Z19DRAFT_1128710 [Tuber borchii]|uniref:Uncharacterized protein n=1 Tax=Tuber borchii TaxID=42251 RepID=A0A2T6ZNT9_TUBBO|nr:hypothetical protein B9Z19DRAFT_1128710 [Tuber borchii]